ncbi:hypothetical protein AB3K92_20480 [Burkholderia sp. Bmkn7]|uniref:hypothetical protein n=1 Tax=Burkholderia sp. Bmkn7 TaxID=3236841 RepID=UPI0034E48A5B
MPRDNLADLPAVIAVARKRSFTRAAGRCATSVAFALAWVMKNRIVCSTIAGLRTDAHRDSDIAMLTLEPGRTTNGSSIRSCRPGTHRRTGIPIPAIRPKAARSEI